MEGGVCVAAGRGSRCCKIQATHPSWRLLALAPRPSLPPARIRHGQEVGGGTLLLVYGLRARRCLSIPLRRSACQGRVRR